MCDNLSFGFDLREGAIGVDASRRLRFASFPDFEDFLSIDPAYWPRLEGVEESILADDRWDGVYYFSTIAHVRQWLDTNNPGEPATSIRIDFCDSIERARALGFYDHQLLSCNRSGQLLGYDVVDWALWSVFHSDIVTLGIERNRLSRRTFNEFGLFATLELSRSFEEFASSEGSEEYFSVAIYEVGKWDGKKFKCND